MTNKHANLAYAIQHNANLAYAIQHNASLTIAYAIQNSIYACLNLWNPGYIFSAVPIF